jgi:hypothetical protein
MNAEELDQVSTGEPLSKQHSTAVGRVGKTTNWG